ncbi:MAG: hypothetical protein ABJG41_13655 [Cyclobacteriaceae bacterium]
MVAQTIIWFYQKAAGSLLLFCALVFLFCAQVTWGQASVALRESRLFATLPESCPTPDSFTLTSAGDLILTCPNYAEKNTQGSLMRLNSDGEFVSLGDFYLNAEQVNVRPMGIVRGDDEILYMCGSVNGKGLVFRVTIEANKIDLEVIASGLNGANGIRYLDGAIYVTTPGLPKISKSKNIGGIYRFEVSDRDIPIIGDSTDTQLIFTHETQNPERQFGLDGIAVDSKGKLYVGDFGDGVVYRMKIRKGQVNKIKVFCQVPNTTGLDGMCFDTKDNLYMAGFSQNEIWKANTAGKVSLIAKNADAPYSIDALDQPADVFVYGNKLLISNFDLMVTKGMINSAHEAPHTISYIELD